MKRILLLLLATLSITTINAQDITDGLRYSSEDLNGTARFRAMGGAFGALGGDLSALGINPAGSAVFLSSFGTITLDRTTSENSVNYFNGMSSTESSEFNFGQAGAVFVFNRNGGNSGWNKFTLGFNYTKTNNFEDNFLASGTGSTSISEYFLGYADGVPLDLLETVDNESISQLYSYLGENEGFGAQQAFLGYQGYVINPESDDLDNTTYTSAISPGSFEQEYSYASTGYNGKFSFNLAGEFQEFLYLGANLNSHFLNFDRSTRFLENNNNPGSETNEVFFSENLNTIGNGFSVQLGAIAKLSHGLRLGASYESPTWYDISEQNTQYLETYSEEFDEEVVVNPNVVNVYPDYTLRTPSKITGSAAILFGTVGLLSFDYSYKDYTEMEFRPKNDPDFELQNAEITNNLRAVSTYRVGAEIRIQELSLRGGYRYEESPYINQTTIGDLYGYSGGVGFDFGGFKLDLAYDMINYSESRPLYQVGLTDTADIDRDYSSIILTLGFAL